MAMKMMKPSALSAEKLRELANKAKAAEPRKALGKSLDPNYPVFATPINSRVMAYVPNVFTEVDEDGVGKGYDYSRIMLHGVTDNGRYAGDYRCTEGIVSEELGYDGTCPLCANVATGWELWNIKKEMACQRAGITDLQSQPAKDISKPFHSVRPVDRAEEFVVFPLVVIKTKGETLTPEVDAEGNLQFSHEWYVVRGSRYDEVWGKVIAGSVEDEEELEGDRIWANGRVVTLDFRVKDDGGKTKIDARSSGQALTVALRPNNSIHKDIPKADQAAIRQHLDGIATEKWTPVQAGETIRNFAFFSMEDLVGFTGEIEADLERKKEAAKSEPVAVQGVNPLDNIGLDTSSAGSAVVVPDTEVDSVEE